MDVTLRSLFVIGVLLAACKPIASVSPEETRQQESKTDYAAAELYHCQKQMAEPRYILTVIEPYLEDKPFRIEIPKANEKAFHALEKRIHAGFKPEGFGNIKGRVVATKPSADHAWNFALDPESIAIGTFSAEVCDGSIEFVAENLSDWLDRSFCPFQGAHLIANIQKVWQIPEGCSD